MSDKSNGLMSVLKVLSTMGAAASNNSSLISQLKATTVTPVVLIEASLAHSEVANNLMHVILNQYTTMYLAVASQYLNLDVNGAKITRTLEKLATDRDVLGAIGNESGSAVKPTDLLSLGFENAKLNEKYITAINDMNSLAIGKVVALNFKSGQNTFEALVNVRLAVKSVTGELLRDIFEANYVELNPFLRIRLSWLGEMTYMEALTASNDVKRQNKVRMNDKDGVVRSNFMETAKNAGYIIASGGNIPINNVSGVNVITTATLSMIERHIRGDFDNFKDRQRFFENTATYLVVVVDEAEETSTFYYRDINKYTTLSNSTLARASNGKSDLEPMVKDLLQGSVPSLR